MMICAGHHLVIGGEHVSCSQLLALGWPAVRTAWTSPAALSGWDAKTWSGRGVAWGRVGWLGWYGCGVAQAKQGNVGVEDTANRQK